MPEEYQVEYRDPAEIIVRDRLRTDWGNLDSLADSILRLGLLHPLVVEDDGITLVSGERRLKAVQRLGWDQVPVHRQARGKPLDAEYDENAERKPFTLGEAQEYLRRKGRDATKKQREGIARETGHSLGTMRRVQEIIRIKDDPQEAPSVKEVAGAEYDKIKDRHDGAAPALRRILAAKRVAERNGEKRKADNLLPGQVMRHTSRPVLDWPDRLWKIIGEANTHVIAGVAAELGRETDPEIPDAELRSMLRELNLRVGEVDTLKQRLRQILEERRFK